MNFTFKEWNMIEQAVKLWKEHSQQILSECEYKEDEFSTYQIYTRQVKKLTELLDKIDNSIL